MVKSLKCIGTSYLLTIKWGRETLKFSAHKNLRQDAYLKLYVKKETEVTSFDEVKFHELPAKVQDQMK